MRGLRPGDYIFIYIYIYSICSLNADGTLEATARRSRSYVAVEWFKFRAGHRSAPFLTDRKYYEDIGVLVP